MDIYFAGGVLGAVMIALFVAAAYLLRKLRLPLSFESAVS
jgi:flagellar biogenesis protein FliO